MYRAAPRCRKHLIYLRLNYAPAYGSEDAKGETGRAAGPTFATCRHVAEKLIEIWNLFGTVLSDPIFLMKKRLRRIRRMFLNFYFSEEKKKCIFEYFFRNEIRLITSRIFPPFLYFNLYRNIKFRFRSSLKQSPRGIDLSRNIFIERKRRKEKKKRSFPPISRVRFIKSNHPRELSSTDEPWQEYSSPREQIYNSPSGLETAIEQAR